MSVQRQEFAQLTVYDPSYGAVGVLALDAKDRLVPVQWMQTVADTDTKSVKQYRNAPMVSLVPFKPES